MNFGKETQGGFDILMSQKNQMKNILPFIVGPKWWVGSSLTQSSMGRALRYTQNIPKKLRSPQISPRYPQTPLHTPLQTPKDNARYQRYQQTPNTPRRPWDTPQTILRRPSITPKHFLVAPVVPQSFFGLPGRYKVVVIGVSGGGRVCLSGPGGVKSCEGAPRCVSMFSGVSDSVFRCLLVSVDVCWCLLHPWEWKWNI